MIIRRPANGIDQIETTIDYVGNNLGVRLFAERRILYVLKRPANNGEAWQLIGDPHGLHDIPHDGDLQVHDPSLLNQAFMDIELNCSDATHRGWQELSGLRDVAKRDHGGEN